MWLEPSAVAAEEPGNAQGFLALRPGTGSTWAMGAVTGSRGKEGHKTSKGRGEAKEEWRKEKLLGVGAERFNSALTKHSPSWAPPQWRA